MTNPNNLNQLILRNMLLEGENADVIFKEVHVFSESNKTDKDKAKILGFIKKEVSRAAKDLLADDGIYTFIDGLSATS